MGCRAKHCCQSTGRLLQCVAAENSVVEIQVRTPDKPRVTPIEIVRTGQIFTVAARSRADVRIRIVAVRRECEPGRLTCVLLLPFCRILPARIVKLRTHPAVWDGSLTRETSLDSVVLRNVEEAGGGYFERSRSLCTCDALLPVDGPVMPGVALPRRVGNHAIAECSSQHSGTDTAVRKLQAASVVGNIDRIDGESNVFAGGNLEAHVEIVRCADDRCQVNIGTPKNGHPGCPYSRKYRHPDAHIYVNMGTPGCPYLRGVYKTRGG